MSEFYSEFYTCSNFTANYLHNPSPPYYHLIPNGNLDIQPYFHLPLPAHSTTTISVSTLHLITCAVSFSQMMGLRHLVAAVFPPAAFLRGSLSHQNLGKLWKFALTAPSLYTAELQRRVNVCKITKGGEERIC